MNVATRAAGRSKSASQGSNISYWLQTAPAFSAQPVSLPPKVDLAILGAGIMGSSLAYWLTRNGLRPLVLERNPSPAAGATGRNGGLVLSGPSLAYPTAIARLGRAAVREISQATLKNRELLQTVLDREGIQAGYRCPGFIVLGTRSEELNSLQTACQQIDADGLACEWLNRTAVIKRLGTEPGSDYLAGYFRPGDGQIHSARYAWGVARAAQRLGAQFAFSCTVKEVAAALGSRGWRVRTNQGEFFAEQIVLALNAWAGDLFPELAALAVPTRGHIWLTEPASFSLTPWLANEGWDYGCQLENGQLLIGGKRDARPDREVGQAPRPGENAPAPLSEVSTALMDVLPRLLPSASHLKFVQQWTGTMAFTPDHQPLVGLWPGRDGLWLMIGFSGHGMAFSQVVPCALAALLSSQPGPPIPPAFSPGRFAIDGSFPPSKIIK